MAKIYATRFHDISTGHRVMNHESKCKHLHGHNYRVHFKIAAENELDSLGRVLDFGVIKSLLAEWLESHWDHKLLIWQDDPWAESLKTMDPEGVSLVHFNPTAENMAQYLLEVIGPLQLSGHPVELVEVKIEETYKCHAEAHK